MVTWSAPGGETWKRSIISGGRETQGISNWGPRPKSRSPPGSKVKQFGESANPSPLRLPGSHSRCQPHPARELWAQGSGGGQAAEPPPAPSPVRPPARRPRPGGQAGGEPHTREPGVAAAGPVRPPSPSAGGRPVPTSRPAPLQRGPAWGAAGVTNASALSRSGSAPKPPKKAAAPPWPASDGSRRGL